MTSAAVAEQPKEQTESEIRYLVQTAEMIMSQAMARLAWLLFLN